MFRSLVEFLFIIMCFNFTPAFGSDKIYSCHKKNRNYDNYEFYEANNFEYETKIEKGENEYGEYYNFAIYSRGIVQKFYFEANLDWQKPTLISEENKEFLFCATRNIEYQFDLSKYGCFKNDIIKLVFLDYNFNLVKETPFSYIKCLTNQER